MMDTIKSWLMLVSGYDDQRVIQARQEGGRPLTPYLTFSRSSGTRSSHGIQTREIVSDSEVDISRSFKSMPQIEVNAFAEDGADLLEDLGSSTSRTDVRRLLNEGNLVLVEYGEPLQVPTVGDTRWRHHYVATFGFSTFRTTTERTYRINRIIIGGSMNDGAIPSAGIEVERE